MSRQDKATTERNARILRDLVKQPDNKSCADCRKNDARWASWNLGVYVCIRCSGIHRSMGTHISKVKSIDLDIWTPEQMENIQKWGNRRANLYWERHLKAGHIPPDHKIESFIRSKYESKRWAMEGPVPSDPSVLDQGGSTAATVQPKPTPTSSAAPAAPASLPKTHPLLSRTAAARPTPAAAPAPAPIVDLFADDPIPVPAVIGQRTTAPPAATTARPVTAELTTGAAGLGPTPAAPAAAPAPTPTSNIFDLDFRAPTPQASKPQTAKADILSLFAASPPAQPTQNNSFFSPAPAPQQGQSQFGSWGGGITSSAPPVPAQSNQVNIGWGSSGIQADQNAWGGFSGGQPQASGAAAQSQAKIAQPSSQAGGMDPWGSMGMANGSSDPWGSSGGLGGFAAPPQAKPQIPAQKKDDPFANIWG